MSLFCREDIADISRRCVVPHLQQQLTVAASTRTARDVMDVVATRIPGIGNTFVHFYAVFDHSRDRAAFGKSRTRENLRRGRGSSAQQGASQKYGGRKPVLHKYSRYFLYLLGDILLSQPDA